MNVVIEMKSIMVFTRKGIQENTFFRIWILSFC